MPREQFDRGSGGTSKRPIGDTEHTRKEAESAASQLVENLANVKRPFEPAIKAVSNSTTLNILSAEEAAKWVDKARSHALTLAKEIPPVVAVPALLQAVTAFYYGPNHEKLQERLPWLGTALKSAFAFVWPNVFVGSRPEKLMVSDLQGLICASAVWEQLEALRLGYEIAGPSAETLTGEGFLLSERMAEVTAETRAAFGQRGRLHRTLNDSVKVVIGQPAGALEAVEHILSGENPRDQQIFGGTIFSGIPREPAEFWAGLWARFHLAMVCVQCCPKPYGLAVFPDIIMARRTQQELPADLLQRAVMALYWNRAWYERRIRQEPWNMIVERPVARIKRNPSLFVAAFIHVCDSLTCFVEASIMAYPESGGVRLPDHVFEQHVSAAFEQKALEIFRKHGYLAGKVTKNGVWILETGRVQLEHRYGKKCPGEIDILAYDAKRDLVSVADCKVLAYPTGLARMRNLVAKIGDQDTESFHSKLTKKVDWILSVQGVGDRQDENTIGMLILDRNLPGMAMTSKNFVCDLATLDGVLAKLPS